MVSEVSAEGLLKNISILQFSSQPFDPIDSLLVPSFALLGEIKKITEVTQGMGESLIDYRKIEISLWNPIVSSLLDECDECVSDLPISTEKESRKKKVLLHLFDENVQFASLLRSGEVLFLFNPRVISVKEVQNRLKVPEQDILSCAKGSFYREGSKVSKKKALHSSYHVFLFSL